MLIKPKQKGIGGGKGEKEIYKTLDLKPGSIESKRLNPELIKA